MGIIQDLKNINLDELRWTLKFGKPVRKGTIYDLREGDFAELPAPVFFLSTGRCGTAWFSELMEADKAIRVFHDPEPTLNMQGRAAFEYYHKEAAGASSDNLIFEMYLAGRENQLRYSFKTGKRIVETNNGITFFGRVLADRFPQAKFVHLVRPPLEFIASGLKRGYYSGTSEDLRRISGEGMVPEWNQYSAVVKTAWLWAETNRFVAKLSEAFPDRFYVFPFQNLESTAVKKLMQFIGVQVNEERIKQSIDRPVNVQKKGKAPAYSEWSEGDRQKVRELCYGLAEKLGMDL